MLSLVCIQLFVLCLQVQVLASGQSSLLSAVLPGNPCGLAKRACKKLGTAERSSDHRDWMLTEHLLCAGILQVPGAVCSPSPSWLACLSSSVLPLALSREGTSSGAKTRCSPQGQWDMPQRLSSWSSPVLDQRAGHTKLKHNCPKDPHCTVTLLHCHIWSSCPGPGSSRR